MHRTHVNKSIIVECPKIINLIWTDARLWEKGPCLAESSLSLFGLFFELHFYFKNVLLLGTHFFAERFHFLCRYFYFVWVRLYALFFHLLHFQFVVLYLHRVHFCLQLLKGILRDHLSALSFVCCC